MSISTSHLQTFLAVMRTGSFAGAAAEIGYSPSNITQQMASLEREIGASLFIRSANSVTPTAEAFIFARQASRVLNEVEIMGAKSRTAPRSGRSQLRMGIFPSLATRILPHVLRHHGWDAIGVDLQVSIAEPWETAEQIRSGSVLDLAFVFQIGETGISWPSTIVREHIADDPFLVVVPQAWGFAEGAQVELGELASRPWIMQFPGGTDGIAIENRFRNLHFKPRVVAFCDDLHATPDLVASGMGAALLPAMSIMRLGGCVRVQVPELGLTRTVLALTSTQRDAKGTQAVVDLFKQACSKLD